MCVCVCLCAPHFTFPESSPDETDFCAQCTVGDTVTTGSGPSKRAAKAAAALARCLARAESATIREGHAARPRPEDGTPQTTINTNNKRTMSTIPYVNLQTDFGLQAVMEPSAFAPCNEIHHNTVAILPTAMVNVAADCDCDGDWGGPTQLIVYALATVVLVGGIHRLLRHQRCQRARAGLSQCGSYLVWQTADGRRMQMPVTADALAHLEPDAGLAVWYDAQQVVAYGGHHPPFDWTGLLLILGAMVLLVSTTHAYM